LSGEDILVSEREILAFERKCVDLTERENRIENSNTHLNEDTLIILFCHTTCPNDVSPLSVVIAAIKSN
jgi:hypothetical protein